MECSICFDAITKATGSTTLSCEHSFHFRCIDEWFTKQLMEDLKQTCPCCRSEGAEMDRCICEMVEEEEEDESEDEDYEEDDEEDVESVGFPDLGSDELFRWERTGPGQWIITSNREMAYESLRCLFGPLNTLEVEQETPAEIAARKIQTIFRGYKNRKVYQGIRALMALNPESYLLM
jgi:hypothetical protein